MAKGKNVHVTQTKTKDWAVKTEKSQRADSVHPTQEKAIQRGKEIAQHNKSELITHGRDGKIRSKDSFGNDPCPPKDKEH